MVDILVW